MTYLEKAQDLYNKIGSGQLLEGFDQYYGDNVVMTEPRGTREGKAVCREYEVQFLGMVKEFHGMEVQSITSDEKNGVTIVESSMDVTFQDGNRANMEQVAVQRWEGDHIVHERFYYQA
ncbi:MAG: nuclear transport factor 2 family protein [Bacteroidia bacterium]|nr:nuclear transport factor 2 family protein [Bacteroidia bacterium]